MKSEVNFTLKAPQGGARVNTDIKFLTRALSCWKRSAILKLHFMFLENYAYYSIKWEALEAISFFHVIPEKLTTFRASQTKLSDFSPGENEAMRRLKNLRVASVFHWTLQFLLCFFTFADQTFIIQLEPHVHQCFQTYTRDLKSFTFH